MMRSPIKLLLSDIELDSFSVLFVYVCCYNSNERFYRFDNFNNGLRLCEIIHFTLHMTEKVLDTCVVPAVTSARHGLGYTHSFQTHDVGRICELYALITVQDGSFRKSFFL